MNKKRFDKLNLEVNSFGKVNGIETILGSKFELDWMKNGNHLVELPSKNDFKNYHNEAIKNLQLNPDLALLKKKVTFYWNFKIASSIAIFVWPLLLVAIYLLTLFTSSKDHSDYLWITSLYAGVLILSTLLIVVLKSWNKKKFFNSIEFKKFLKDSAICLSTSQFNFFHNNYLSPMLKRKFILQTRNDGFFRTATEVNKVYIANLPSYYVDIFYDGAEKGFGLKKIFFLFTKNKKHPFINWIEAMAFYRVNGNEFFGKDINSKKYFGMCLYVKDELAKRKFQVTDENFVRQEDIANWEFK